MLLLPSLAVALLPFALVWLPGARWRLAPLLIAGALTGLFAALALAAPWERLPRWCPSLLTVAYLLVVGLLRVAGGASGIAPIALLPVLWVGVCGSRRHLAAVIAVVALLLLGPVIALGGAGYPPASLRAAVLLIAVAGMVGWTLQSLAAYARSQRREHCVLLGELDRLAHTDALTLLPNRRSWEARLEAGLAWARRTDEPLTVGLIDLDGLKAINDEQGHSAGDALLRRIASNWAPVLRRADLLARIGGDEFAILLHGCTPPEANEVVDRLHERIPVPYSCSVGLASWDGSESAAELMHRADQALYAAKRERRPRRVAA